MQIVSKKVKALLTPEHAAISILMLAGFILRIRQYLIGRSLWVDEAMLALNIVNRNFAGLFQPLDYDQGAPIGFLLFEKFFNILLGRNEYVLRLLPLVLGLLSLWIFYLILKQYTRGAGLVIAFALAVLNPTLIYYSSEVKQYIGDVFVTTSLILIITYFFEKPSQKQFGILALMGFFALWFSHPSVFILAGIGTTLLFSYIKKWEFKNIWLITITGVFWLANIGLLYSLTLGNLQQNSFMRNYWQGAFAPMPPWSAWKWYWGTFQANANSHYAITFAPWILLIFILTGWFVLFQTKRVFAITIAWTLFFTMLASSLALYPSLERMVLFLTPIVIMLIGISLEAILQKFRSNVVIQATIALSACVYLFYGALPLTVEQFLSPKYFEHIRPTMGYLQENWKDGDVMYISNGGIPAFEYYAPMYGLENISYIAGNRDDYGSPSHVLKRFDPLKGQQRVWVLFSHVYEKGGFNEKDFIFDHLKKDGRKIREFRQPNTSVFLYLFDLK
jgi:hypothetical protein